MDATIGDGLEELENFDDLIEVDVISLDEEKPQIQTIQIEKQPKIEEDSPKGLTETINESSSKVGGKGPLYQFRTKKTEEDDKNRSISTD